ncbi:MAG TPA: mechanosensitive ion channel [Clostridiaceae bacterium]|nr:mechanosensitive ion channel [Clostridiaceae bacterium]
MENINKLLLSYGVSDELSLYLSYGVAIVIIIFVSLLTDLITKKFLLKIVRIYIIKSKAKWDDLLLKKRVFEQLAHIPPVLIIHAFAPVFPAVDTWIQRIAFSYIIINIVLAINKILDVVNDVYSTYEISKTRPIKGYLQVVSIFISATATVIIISVLIERSPWILLSGIGAATAVLMLIFQNSILGIVASIQLTTNNMVQIGDWIEMPSHGADGDVIDISLHTVKVQNWDKTIVTIPTHKLISESFKNWRGMQEAGGRRIKRSIYIDMTSVKFCDEEMLERFKKIQYIKEYIEKKEAEIEDYNKLHNVDTSSIVNGRRLTNLGTFRAYVESYLNNHSNINKKMTRMVRQLQPAEYGLPLEIYAFTNETEWIKYEAIQSDIFDHILAVVPEFDLKIYQKPAVHNF